MLSGFNAVVENEFGEVGLDGALIQKDIPVKELSAGCVCCTLSLDLQEGIVEIANKYQPDRILIEPSGIGKLSDVISACEKAKSRIDFEITQKIVLVDACDCAAFLEGFGQFYGNQITHANLIFLSNVVNATQEELAEAKESIRVLNPDAVIYEGDFRMLEQEELLAILDMAKTIVEGSEGGIDDTVQMGTLFSNVALEESCPMTEEEVGRLLAGLSDRRLGYVLRAKGIVPASDGGNWHFDYTMSKQSYEKMSGENDDLNRVIVIGSELNKKEIRNYIYSFGEEDE